MPAPVVERQKFVGKGSIDARGGLRSRGMPVFGSGSLIFKGDVYHVDSGHAAASNTNDGKSPDFPLATIDAAVGKCAANNGDVILVSEGHAETITTAGAIALDVAGVTVLCLGEGAARPTITFSSTDNSASILVTAANVTWLGGLLIANDDAMTNPVHVQAADFTIDTTFRDTSSTVEAARAILTTAAADRLTVRLRYEGQTGGDAGVNAIRLVGVDEADIEIDFYGKVSTAVVEFLTTACTNVRVRGRMYVSGTTDGSKDVVDTVTGSTWDAEIWDAAAAASFSGGSGAALAKDDVSAVAADVTTVKNVLFDTAGVATYPAAAAPANGVSLAEVLRDVWDALRNGTGGAEPGANKSIVDAVGFDGAAAVTASAGMLRTMNSTTFIVKKTLTSSAIVQAGVDVTGLSSVGDLLIENVTIQADATGLAGGTNFTLETNNAKGSAVFLSSAVSGLGANALMDLDTASVTSKNVVLESGKKVVAKCTVADCTGAGTIDVYLLCRRLADNATLAAV